MKPSERYRTLFMKQKTNWATVGSGAPELAKFLLEKSWNFKDTLAMFTVLATEMEINAIMDGEVDRHLPAFLSSIEDAIRLTEAAGGSENFRKIFESDGSN